MDLIWKSSSTSDEHFVLFSIYDLGLGIQFGLMY